MEIDEIEDSVSITNVQSIETGVKSIEINTDAEMSDESYIPIGNSINLPVKELNESEKAILQFQKERDDTTFSRTCLFCKKHFIGKRCLILDHLADQHHFFIGQSDNLVYVNDFLNILESMLSKLQCLYCEKTFKDWPALKEHMRKKLHKRINPNNKLFDKFYMINYLNTFNNIDDDTSQDMDDEREIIVGPKDETIICLFCDKEYPNFDEVTNHLEVTHEFDFKKMIKDCGLSFYHQVKLINFIRQKVLVKECPICETTFETKEHLANHMKVSRHIKLIPKRSRWNLPEYFFPTLETDYLLCSLPVDEEGFDESDNDDATVRVISEEIALPKSSVLVDEVLRKELL